MENKNDYEGSKIVEFFRDSTVFLTGGTGFLGKLMINKLLSTCQVSCIYLLIRKKTSKCSSERLQEFLKEPVFAHLASKVPDWETRIKLVEGDCSLQNLGLSAEDEEILCQSVNFVFHCAAAMNMLGSCKKAIEINIRGTLHLVNLANKMNNLKTFVYVSSLGAFLERDEIDQKLYESHLEYDDLLNLLKIDNVLPLDELDEKRIIGNKSTVYMMTKAAAENIFLRENLSVPVAVFRFLLAFPCLKEPMAGWTDGFYGPNGIFVLHMLNIIPVTYWEGDVLLEILPADIIVNAIIATTQYSYNGYEKINDGSTIVPPFVYNYTYKFHKNALPFKHFDSYMKREFNYTHRYYSNKFIFMLWNIMYGYIPALIVDFFLWSFGIKFRYFRAYRSIVKFNLSIFPSNLSSRVNTSNVQNCWNNLNDLDKQLFSFDLSNVVWDAYLPSTANSIREYHRIFLKKNEKMRLVIFCISKIRLAIKIFWVAFGLYCVYRILIVVDSIAVHG